MSIKVTGTGQGLSRTTNLPNHNLAYTMAGWVNMTSVSSPSGTYRALFDIDAGSGANTGDILYMTGDGAVPSIWINNTASAVGTEVVNTTKWLYMAMVRESATRLLLYSNCRLDGTLTTSVAARAATTEIGIGQALSTSSGEDLQSGQFEDVRIWRRALTLSELRREMVSAVPYNRAGLVANVWSQTTDDIQDYAVGGRWTITGTLSRGAPISPAVALVWPRRRTVLNVTSANVTVAVPLGTLTLTGFAPTVVNPKSVSVPLGTLTLTGFAPSVRTAKLVQVPLGTLTMTGFAPAVSTPRTVAVPLGTLPLSAFAPTVVTPRTVSMPLGTLALTAFAPTVVVVSGTVVAVPLGTLTLSAFAPTVVNPQSVQVPLGTLTMEGFAPSVVTGAAQVLTPSRGGFDPSRKPSRADEERDEDKRKLRAIIEAAIAGDKPVSAAARAVIAAEPQTVAEIPAQTLAQLADMAEESRMARARVAELDSAIAAAEQRQRILKDDEDLIRLLGASGLLQ